MVSANILVGSLYFSTSAVCLPMQIRIAYIILSHAQYRNSCSYQIMLHIGLADCIQLLIHLYSGIGTLCGFETTTLFEIISGAVLNSSWIIMNLLILVLALNRLEVVAEFKVTRLVHPNKLYNVLSGMCWCVGLLFCGSYLTPYAHMEYDDVGFFWSLVGDPEMVAVMTKIEICCTVSCLITTFCIYVVICAVLLAKKSIFLQNTQNLPKHELRVLAQAFTTFGYTSVLTVCWHWGRHFLPDSWWTEIVINILWIFDNGALNPLLYIIVNRAIREKFFSSTWCKPEMKVFYLVAGRKIVAAESLYRR
ncbi:hypothetical protein QR680_018009 [Steinernema hermaphroditum]|uniref:Uncharacterized protein n=1 Tax=Steinernema hermaphroditum TaxID=289476 RepID=A0AA39HIT5_9BILA|nr:hypothetical protein QR680_018009 [Steinernema hermaphroditum]